MPMTSAATRRFLLPFWWLHATVTEGMLEELYWWRSTITSPVGLGLLGLDLLSMLRSLTKNLFGVGTPFILFT